MYFYADSCETYIFVQLRESNLLMKYAPIKQIVQPLHKNHETCLIKFQNFIKLISIKSGDREPINLTIIFSDLKSY